MSSESKENITRNQPISSVVYAAFATTNPIENKGVKRPFHASICFF